MAVNDSQTRGNAMNYKATKYTRVSVSRAIAELNRHECVKQCHVVMLPSPCILVVSIDGEAVSFKIDAHGLVGARRILDWLGY